MAQQQWMATGVMLAMQQMGATHVKTTEEAVFFDVPLGSDLDNDERLALAANAFKELFGLKLRIKRVPAVPGLPHELPRPSLN